MKTDNIIKSKLPDENINKNGDLLPPNDLLEVTDQVNLSNNISECTESIIAILGSTILNIENPIESSQNFKNDEIITQQTNYIKILTLLKSLKNNLLKNIKTTEYKILIKDYFQKTIGLFKNMYGRNQFHVINTLFPTEIIKELEKFERHSYNLYLHHGTRVKIMNVLGFDSIGFGKFKNNKPSPFKKAYLKVFAGDVQKKRKYINSKI